MQQPMNGYSVFAPDWLRHRAAGLPDVITDPDERMEVANELAAESIAQGTGGPFGALIVDGVTGAVLGAGANLVTSSNLATAHAEVVTLSMAQFQAKAWNLSEIAQEPTLIVNAQPCAMCLGALIWSGIRHLEFAARGADVEAITGFDEGPVPEDWAQQLERRGITVAQGRGETRAHEILSSFRRLVDNGSLPLYNGRAN
ncbi:nucleoside deaminase [Curtobacterium flaccumfaciens]|uniref:nucleoside deaminase n=1 Tax=Curtobacterium flaccumfaciens TaxID=2035 RepID=UPI00188C23A8|nr:nucleoside deaminase [Curtobacterium flaccumfaciens]MBF4595731.1 nucleoside deaminase [Curtobacterium flaccumfaciens]